jgi:hypothetical protein
VLIPQLFWSQLCYSGLNSGISFLDEVFRCCVAGERKPKVLGFLFLIGLGLAGLRRAPSRPTSRLENSNRQLVGRLAQKVESDSPVEIPGAPGRLVDDLKTEC